MAPVYQPNLPQLRLRGATWRHRPGPIAPDWSADIPVGFRWPLPRSSRPTPSTTLSRQECRRSGRSVEFRPCLSCICAFALLFVVCAARALAASGPQPPKAAVVSEHLPSSDPTLAQEIAAQVRAVGYATEFITTAVLTNESLLAAKRYDLLVLPGARSLPIASTRTIEGYLRGGGDLLALGLPAWQFGVFQANGKWFTRESYEQMIAAQRPQHVVEDFARAELSRWTRSAGEPSGKAQYELANTDHGKALHVTIAHLGGWETLASPALPTPFPTNHTLTCFRAKGSPRTRQLVLEWRERDGSRWIATVDVTPQWQDYTLLPDRFKAWPPGSVAEPRRFNPAQAVTCCVGLALSHTALEGDQHEYWFADLGTAPNPLGDALPPAETSIPVLESISPSYQCYPITTPVIVRPDRLGQSGGVWERDYGHKEEVLSCVGLQPRARGVQGG